MANRMVTLWTTQCELEWRKSWLVYVWALGLILENSCRYRHSYNGAAARKWRVIQGIFPDLEHEGCQPLLGVPFFFFSFPSPRSRAPKIQLWDREKLCKLPQRGLGQSPTQNHMWCIFCIKIWPLVTTILAIFLRIKQLNFMANFLSLFMHKLEMLK